MIAFKRFMKSPTTLVGLVFGLVVPLLFVIIWMTGYNGATERVDQLHVGIVADGDTEGMELADHIATNAPFYSERISSLEEAQAKMNEGDLHMVISIPASLAQDVGGTGTGKLTYYVNEANSDVAKNMMESIAAQITSQVSGSLTGVSELPVKAEIIKTNEVSNFSISMLPMILGFITYIAVMTMNIQFNLTSKFMQRDFSKWEIFFTRQKLYLIITILFPLLITGLAMMFVEVHSSFLVMWGYHMIVYLTCICVTQMAFVLFGQAGPLFNVALVPLQLLTAGNIIPAIMLTGFYRQLGHFLPAPNAIQGYMKLIHGSGGSVVPYIINMLLISVICWGVTVLITALKGRSAAAKLAPTTAQAH